MNKLSIHHVTDITISREVFDSSANHDGFTVVNITAEDKTGTRVNFYNLVHFWFSYVN